MAMENISASATAETTLNTLPQFLLDRAKRFAEIGRSAYLIEGISGKRGYYKDFDSETGKIASHFYKNGLRKNDIVIYMTNNPVDVVVLIVGVWRANGVVRSLYSDEGEDTVLEKVKESKAKWIFCDDCNFAVCQSVVSRCGFPVEIVLCEGSVSTLGVKGLEEFLADDGTQIPALNITEHDMAIIFPTSGTTGPSKGAVHSHKSVIGAVRSMARVKHTYPKPNLIVTKATHISGTISPLIILSCGKTLISLSKVTKEIILQTVDKYKPGFISAFPTFMSVLASSDAAEYDVTSIEIISCMGSPLTSSLIFRSLPNVKYILNSYGLTEALNAATTANLLDESESAETSGAPDCSIGKPYVDGKAEVRDLSSGVRLGPNQQGEIWIKAESVFIGYFLNPKATEETLVDGWLRTGDVGYYDEKGYFFLVDRAKDIFKCFGNHVSPNELEGVISKHPEVKDACVIPIACEEGGEAPRAFVTLKNKEGQDLTKLPEKIRQFADEKLAAYKKLRGGVYIVDDLPRGKSGKVTRNLVAQIKLP